MPGDPSLTEREQRLNEVVAAFIVSDEAGQPPDRRELLARHPDLVADLQAFFADHDRMRQAIQPFRPVDPAGVPTLAPDKTGAGVTLGTVRYFGDYELLEEIARGGMGVVYRA